VRSLFTFYWLHDLKVKLYVAHNLGVGRIGVRECKTKLEETKWKWWE